MFRRRKPPVTIIANLAPGASATFSGRMSFPLLPAHCLILSPRLVDIVRDIGSPPRQRELSNSLSA
jgi:hypothetical protein